MTDPAAVGPVGDVDPDTVASWKRDGTPGWCEHDLPRRDGRRVGAAYFCRVCEVEVCVMPFKAPGDAGLTYRVHRWLGRPPFGQAMPLWPDVCEVVGAGASAGAWYRLGTVLVSAAHIAQLEAGDALDIAIELAIDWSGTADELVTDALRISHVA